MCDGNPGRTTSVVPTREECIHDMFNIRDRAASISARSYYYKNYASETERRMMDMEDHEKDARAKFIFGFILGVFCTVIVCTIIKFI